MLRISLLKKKGVQKFLDRLQEEGAEIRDYDCFAVVSSDKAKGYMSSCCGNYELTLKIDVNGYRIEIPASFIDAVYCM